MASPVIVEADIPRYALIIHLIQCVSQIHACQHILRPVQTFQCCHHRHIGIIAQRGNRRNLVCAAVQRNALRVLPQVGLKAADEGFPPAWSRLLRRGRRIQRPSAASPIAFTMERVFPGICRKNGCSNAAFAIWGSRTSAIAVEQGRKMQSGLVF